MSSSSSSSSSIIFSLILFVAVFATSVAGGGRRNAMTLQGQHPGDAWKVTISNDLSGGPLGVHCKSKDNDLGLQTIQIPGGVFSFQFKENFSRTTLFWCTFQSQTAHAEFEVFWPETSTWLERRCNFATCVWHARDNGFYLDNIPAHTTELVHQWVPNAN